VNKAIIADRAAAHRPVRNVPIITILLVGGGRYRSERPRSDRRPTCAPQKACSPAPASNCCIAM